MRRAISPGVYADSIQPGGQRMIRTYSNGRKVYYRWSETDPATGAGVWLLDPEGGGVRTFDVILARKRAGIDCDQDESAVVKRHFDRYASPTDAEVDEAATWFPLEFAEWCEEREEGLR